MPLLTTSEVAKEIRRSPKTVRRLAKDGVLRKVPNQRPLLFTQQAIEEFKTGQKPIALY